MIGKQKPEYVFTDFIGGESELVFDGYLFLNNEILRLDDIDFAQQTINVGRGAMDSYPLEHAANSIIYFVDSNLGADPTEYATGQAVDAKVLTQTSLGILDEDDATTVPIVFTGRQNRPYLPAQIQVNGVYFPARVVTNEITITWTHQDRTQQVAGIEDWYSVGSGFP